VKEFTSILAFTEHLTAVALTMHEADQAILHKGAQMIEKRAKEKIGEYQDQVGPFIAWPELAESTKSDRASQGYPEDEPLLRSGEMRHSIEHTVGKGEAQIGSNSDIAVYQELGTQHIPPRSFLGGAGVEETPRICELAGVTVVAALVGEKVFEGALPLKGF
jgi:phage gpG-like protein